MFHGINEPQHMPKYTLPIRSNKMQIKEPMKKKCKQLKQPDRWKCRCQNKMCHSWWGHLVSLWFKVHNDSSVPVSVECGLSETPAVQGFLWKESLVVGCGTDFPPTAGFWAASYSPVLAAPERCCCFADQAQQAASAFEVEPCPVVGSGCQMQRWSPAWASCQLPLGSGWICCVTGNIK